MRHRDAELGRGLPSARQPEIHHREERDDTRADFGEHAGGAAKRVAAVQDIVDQDDGKVLDASLDRALASAHAAFAPDDEAADRMAERASAREQRAEQCYASELGCCDLEGECVRVGRPEPLGHDLQEVRVEQRHAHVEQPSLRPSVARDKLLVARGNEAGFGEKTSGIEHGTHSPVLMTISA